MAYNWSAGLKHNYLTFVRFDPSDTKNAYFTCDCGREVSKDKSKVRRGIIKSCGCMKKALLTDVHLKHGLWNTKLYNAWGAMGSGGGNNASDEVAEVWRGEDGFFHFLRDMGTPPTDGAVVVRPDPSQPFGPNNAIWATMSEQRMSAGKMSNNTSGVKGVSFNTSKDKWEASVTSHGTRLRQYFPPNQTGFLQAVAWVRMTREKLHGDFANHGD